MLELSFYRDVLDSIGLRVEFVGTLVQNYFFASADPSLGYGGCTVMFESYHI